ncbi:predicted pyridoxal-phosphate dependent deaminase [Candidatus Vecturithrix granuli]|uniref:Predicted pyridoxal-phosphate dependent deaminase n=1 Tax=Vecturithrix granuli TaxID=1499967 RepID=A0A081BZS9_VECG1|nr:predicted pyridoxal-phosphate dependent deaminase [Candidatus Vecturithrix granuli]
MEFVFPPKIALAHLPTPIHQLSRLAAQCDGPEIFVKRDDFTGLECSGNKVRKLEFVAAHALQEGCDVLITCGGMQSNHSRATAAVAARLGLQCHLVLRGAAPEVPGGNLFLDQLLGAKITYLPNPSYDDLITEMERLAQDYAKQGHKALVVPMGASNALGSLGYVAATQEMMSQFQDMALTPDYIVAAIGSGGTLAGLILGKKLFGLSSQIIGVNVCDNAAYFHQEIAHIVREFCERYQVDVKVEPKDYRIIDGYVGAGYSLSRPQEREFIVQVARTEGIVLDTAYTGKALYGLTQEIQKGTFKQGEMILFIHTGGLYALFANPTEFVAELR